MMEDPGRRPEPQSAPVPVAVAALSPNAVIRVAPVAAVPTPEANVEPAYAVRPTSVDDGTVLPPRTMIARVIWYVSGVLSVLLAARFLLALAGANGANGFDRFISGASGPFVAPFTSLFGATPASGAPRLEVSILVALAVYALVAWGLVRLVTIGRRHVQ